MSSEDPQLPGGFEGETISCRRFMSGTAQAAGAIVGAAMALPALGFATAPVFARAGASWQNGPIARFSDSD